MYLSEFVSDKISHSDDKGLQVAIDATLEWLQRAGVLTTHQVRSLPHFDAPLDHRKSGLRL